MTPSDLRALIDADPSLAEPMAAGRTGEVAAALNARTQTMSQPALMYESELAGLLSLQSLAKLLQYVNFALIKHDIEAQNRVGVALWAGKLALCGILTADEIAAVVAYTQRTEDVPASRYEVASGSIGAVATISQVDEARGLP